MYHIAQYVSPTLTHAIRTEQAVFVWGEKTPASAIPTWPPLPPRYRPAEDPASVDTTTIGIVGLYHMDAAPVNGGTEPDVSVSNLTMQVIGNIARVEGR